MYLSYKENNLKKNQQILLKKNIFQFILNNYVCACVYVYFFNKEKIRNFI